MTLFEAVRTTTRRLHCSPRTEEAYFHWIRAFIRFHGRRHPRDLGAAEITAFLNWDAKSRSAPRPEVPLPSIAPLHRPRDHPKVYSAVAWNGGCLRFTPQLKNVIPDGGWRPDPSRDNLRLRHALRTELTPHSSRRTQRVLAGHDRIGAAKNEGAFGRKKMPGTKKSIPPLDHGRKTNSRFVWLPPFTLFYPRCEHSPMR